MTYRAIAQQVAEASRARGFVQTTWADLPVRLRAIESEIRELVDEMEEIEPSTRAMSLESADIGAFVLLVLYDLGHTNWHPRLRMHRRPPVFCAPDVMVRPLREYVDRSYRAWRRGRRDDALVSLELLLAQLEDIRRRCLDLPNDLQTDIQYKLAINTGRPRLNGGIDARS